MAVEQVSNPELIDEDNREWTEEIFARAVPFSSLPKELQDLLSQPKTIRPVADEECAHHPTA